MIIQYVKLLDDPLIIKIGVSDSHGNLILEEEL